VWCRLSRGRVRVRVRVGVRVHLRVGVRVRVRVRSLFVLLSSIETFVYSVEAQDTSDEKGEARDTGEHVTL